MKRKENSGSLPIDIIIDILSRSSAKTVARFGLASKLCASILGRPDFTELFLTRSTAARRPRILFAVEYSDKWCFFSAPQPQNPREKATYLVVESDFQMGSLGAMCREACMYVSGLVCFLPCIRIAKEDHKVVPVICNPSTGQYAKLPQLTRKTHSKSFLGYDPIGKQYKVLTISRSLRIAERETQRILTLGAGEVSWRKIRYPVIHCPIGEGICIDGVLYYIALVAKSVKEIACFDVRYEKLTFLDAESTQMMLELSYSFTHTRLINYVGKLGVISWRFGPGSPRYFRLCLLVLEDGERYERFKHYNFYSPKIDVKGDVSVVGVTASGEIILSMDYTDKPYSVFYFNPKWRTLKRVGIQGFEESDENRARVYTFVNHVEDLKFIR